jgi:hypothetical protein
VTPSLGSLDSLLLTIVLATLAVGLPVVLVLAIRFFWDRSLQLGRSRELEKLIWQLHRIASAMEHQMNLAFSPVQPGTEEPRDLVYLQQLPTQQAPATASAAAANAAAAGATAITGQPAGQPPAATAAQQAPAAQQRRDPAAQPQRAGVNSMFGM